MPELVECYHYGQSLPFCKRAVTSLKNYINGVSYISSEENGLGFDDYMNFVNAQYNNEQLSAVINNQFDEILTGLNSINDPLSNEVIANKADVQEVANQIVVCSEINAHAVMAKGLSSSSAAPNVEELGG